MKWCSLVWFRIRTYLKNPLAQITLLTLPFVLWAVMNMLGVNKEEVLSLPIGVVDLDQSEYSQLVIERVGKKDTIRMKIYSEEQALKEVSTGKLEAVYIIQKGLMDKVVQGDVSDVIEIVKSPLSFSAEIIGELFASEVMRLCANVDAANSIVSRYGNKTRKDNKVLWKEAWEHTDAYWEPEPVIQIAYQQVEGKQIIEGSTDELGQIRRNIVDTLLLVVLILSIFLGCGTLLYDKNNGMIKRMATLPTSVWTYISSSIFAIAMLHMIAVGLALLLTGAKWGMGEVTQQLCLFTLYIFWVASAGVIIVALTKTTQQLLLIIPSITVVVGCMGVGFFPLSQLTPIYWVLQGRYNFTQSVMVLVLYTLVLFGVGIVVLKQSESC